jgi:hypothetical protein
LDQVAVADSKMKIYLELMVVIPHSHLSPQLVVEAAAVLSREDYQEVQVAAPEEPQDLEEVTEHQDKEITELLAQVEEDPVAVAAEAVQAQQVLPPHQQEEMAVMELHLVFLELQ